MLQRLLGRHQACIAVGKEFANRFVRTETCDEGPVQDFVLGAHVFGTQQTRARTCLEFLPNENAGQVLLLLDGTTNNQTTSHTPQAIVQSEGSYRFQLSKQIEFDGRAFRTRSPAAFLTIQQRHVGAHTPVSPLPLIGPLASMTVLRAAEQRRPLSERIAAMRLTEQVGPRFNSEVDRQLSDVNTMLTTRVWPMLSEWNALPSRVRTATTSGTLFLAARLDPSSGMLSSPPLPALPPLGPEGAALFVHESAFNDMVAKLPLAGLEVPDTALQRLGELAAGRGFDLGRPQLATLIFAREQPVSFRLEGGQLRIEVRLGFRPVLGPKIPTQRITLALTPDLQQDRLILRTALEDVRPLDPTGDDAVSTIARNVLSQQLEQQFDDATLPAAFEVPLGEIPGTVSLRLAHLLIEGGWLAATLHSSPAQAFPVQPAPVQPSLILPGPILPDSEPGPVQPQQDLLPPLLGPQR